MERIPVCYCGNRGIFGGIFMSALSLMSHSSAPLEILLLTMDLQSENPAWAPFSEEQRILLENTLKEKNGDSRVKIFDVTEHHLRYFKKGKNNNNSYTPYASIRLFLDLLEVPDKIVYLDADIMCNSDVAEYYNINIEDYELGATVDIVGRKFFGKDYCNSGVLLLNMKKIRETDVFERARIRVRDKWMMMPDQSAIHKELTAKLILPYRFNEQREMKPDTVFKHFCMGYRWRGIFLTRYNHKQWHRDKVHKVLGIHEFDGIFELYDKILAEGENKKLISI